MADLLTIPTLRVLTREDIPDADPFAAWVIRAASIIVLDEAQQPLWTIDGETAAPGRVIIIAEQLAKRTYINPDAERSYNTGPIGGSTVEDFARTLELTDVELAVLHAYRPTGDPDREKDGLIFTMSTSNRVPGVRGPIVLNDQYGSGIIYGTEGEFDTAFEPVVI